MTVRVNECPIFQQSATPASVLLNVMDFTVIPKRFRVTNPATFLITIVDQFTFDAAKHPLGIFGNRPQLLEHLGSEELMPSLDGVTPIAVDASLNTIA